MISVGIGAGVATVRSNQFSIITRPRFQCPRSLILKITMRITFIDIGPGATLVVVFVDWIIPNNDSRNTWGVSYMQSTKKCSVHNLPFHLNRFASTKSLYLPLETIWWVFRCHAHYRISFLSGGSSVIAKTVTNFFKSWHDEITVHSFSSYKDRRDWSLTPLLNSFKYASGLDSQPLCTQLAWNHRYFPDRSIA